jgi:transposase InsO family protein
VELEAEAELGIGLKYIGGRAIRTRLKQKNVTPLPSIPTIERVISEAGLTKSKSQTIDLEIQYPHLQPTQPHQLCQVDIVPRYLQGGQRIACFNAIDVVSRYPTGSAYAQRRSQDAADFLVHAWQELGIPQYTQVDNEGCFSGGTTHAHVLGKVVRLALMVGTELVFSPVYHPQSNGTVERFHQDYDQHVWQGTYLRNLVDVNQQGQRFFTRYRKREDHSQLKEQSPTQVHHSQEPNTLDMDFQMMPQKIPLRVGRVHFMRKVSQTGTVRVLNVDWNVPRFDSTKGVWVTLEIQADGAMLFIYDEAPDVMNRQCLAVYPFPLKESVMSDVAVEAVPEEKPEVQQLPVPQETPIPMTPAKPKPLSPIRHVVQAGEWMMFSSLSGTARLARHIIFTMY